MASEGVECESWTDREGATHVAMKQERFLAAFPDAERAESWLASEERPLQQAEGHLRALEQEEAALRVESRSTAEEQPPERSKGISANPASETTRLREVQQAMERDRGLDKTRELSKKVGAR